MLWKWSIVKMGVYDHATRADAVRSGNGKIIKGRWLDISRGDSVNPDYRSRFVEKLVEHS